jgi:hypothetical protein
MRTKIIILLILALFISSCGGGGPDYKDVNYHVGKQGLVMELVENAPPETLYEENRFEVAVFVENLGATDVEYGLLSVDYGDYYVQSLLPENYGDKLLIDMAGKSIVWPEGEKNYFRITALQAKPVQGNFEKHETTVTVDLCYPYQTVLAEQVCIQSLTLDQRRVKVCEVEDIKGGSGQGAPLVIEEVEVRMVPAGYIEEDIFVREGPLDPESDDPGGDVREQHDIESIPVVRPEFTLHINNEGGGYLLSPPGDPSQVCLNPDLEHFNEINVSGEVANKTLTCNPTAARLEEGKAEVTCYLDTPLPVHSNYQTTARFVLDYTYKTNIAQDIEIRRMSGGFEPVIGDIESRECREYSGSEDMCIYYRTDKGCAYCRKDGACSAGDCSQCGEYTKYEPTSGYCVEDKCPNNRLPIVSVTQPSDNSKLLLICSDGDNIDRREECGCDDYIEYTFANSVSNCNNYDKSRARWSDPNYEYEIRKNDNYDGICVRVTDNAGAQDSRYFTY